MPSLQPTYRRSAYPTPTLTPNVRVGAWGCRLDAEPGCSLETSGCSPCYARLQAQLGLATAESYQLLSGGNRVLKNGSMDDAKEFAELRRAMSTMGFSEDLQLQLLGVISICLQLGNVSFSGGESGRQRGNEACTVVGGDWAQWSAHLLGEDEHTLTKAADPCNRGRRPIQSRLQSHAIEAATPCIQAATLSISGVDEQKLAKALTYRTITETGGGKMQA